MRSERLSRVITRIDYCNLIKPCRSTCMQTGATATSAKRGRWTGAEFGSASAHQSCTTTAALASSQASRYVQDNNASYLTKHCPSYLADTTNSQRRHLRSYTTTSVAVRRARTQFGKRAFSVCGPDVWNSLPIALRNIDSYPAFIRALESHLFSCVFSS